jgi:putative FmdB family regulatory protein
MPIYEYECCQCGKVTEALQKFSDAPLTTCGHCSGELRKLISNSAFHLKGSGWYVTDYAGKNPKGGAEAKESGEKKTEAKTAPETCAAKKAE